MSLQVGDYFKTKLGKFRAISIGVGLFAVAFSGAGHDYQWLIRTRVFDAWSAKLALAIIIIAWLFSIIMLVLAIASSSFGNPIIIMSDLYGHVGLGGGLLLAFLLCLYWVYSLLDNSGCFDSKNDHCYSLVLLSSVTLENGWVYRGANGILWIFAAIFALVQGILFIVIFMMLKKTIGQTRPGMMMINQTGSQAPQGSYPSQEGSQQQAPPPEQQPSGHHSKHSHKV